MRRPPQHPDNVEQRFDFAELDGFTFSGRRMAIEDWKRRKEARAFKRLCARLRARKWRLDHPQRRKAWVRHHYHANKARLKAKAKAWYEANRAKVLARRHAEVVEARKGRSCLECGASLDHRRADALYCSNPCRQRGGYKRRGEHKHRVNLQAVITAELARRPWQTAREISDATATKFRSIASKLTQLRKRGVVRDDGAGKGKRWALVAEGDGSRSA